MDPNAARRNNLVKARAKLQEHIAKMRMEEGTLNVKERKTLVPELKVARKQAAARVEAEYLNLKMSKADTSEPVAKADAPEPVTRPVAEPVTRPVTRPVAEPVTRPVAETAPAVDADSSDSDTEGDFTNTRFAEALTKARSELKMKYRERYKNKYDSLTSSHIDMAQRILERDTLKKAALKIAEDRLKDDLSKRLEGQYGNLFFRR
jgi:hypothetical protein